MTIRQGKRSLLLGKMERKPKKGKEEKTVEKGAVCLAGDLAVVEQSRLNRQAQKMEKNQQFPVFGDSWFLLFWEGERATPDRKGGET